MARKPERKSQRPQLLAICGGLIFITLAIYWPALSSDFVNYDDLGYVTTNSHVQQGLKWTTVKWAFTSREQSNWHPLTWLSHALDCQLYGLKPSGHHLTNLLFHVANALLVLWVFLYMTGALWRSAIVAALFAWHPMHVESVAWIAERKDVLSAFFWLLTMLAYVRYVEELKIQGSKFKVYYGLTLLCFVLGLMAKPMVVTLPFVLLLLDFWPLRRISDLRSSIYEQMATPQAKSSASSTASIPQLIFEKVPFFVLAAGASVVTYLVQQKGGAVSGSISFGARVANALVSYLRYTGKLFWPENLSVLYPHPGHWPAALVAGSALFLVVVTAGVLWVKRSQPYLLTGWFWFIGTLVPVIGLVQVGVQSMADRYTYLPGIGIFVMAVWGIAELLERFKAPHWLPATIGVGSLLGCMTVTLNQVGYWKDSQTLFTRAVTVTKDNYLAYNNLGFFLSNQGRNDEAMTNFEKSLAINPNYEDAQNNMGLALARKGRMDEAIAHYKIALRIQPKLAEAHNNLGNALGEQGKTDEATAEYVAALRIDPENENALNNLGIARAMEGKPAEAEELLTRAARLKPSDGNAHGNLGTLFASQNKLDEAAKEFQIALQLNPNDAKTQNNFANVLSQSGKGSEAIGHYEAALKLQPDNPEANYNLGLALLQQGKRQEALDHFAEAVRLRPTYAEAQRQLTTLTQAGNH